MIKRQPRRRTLRDNLRKTRDASRKLHHETLERRELLAAELMDASFAPGTTQEQIEQWYQQRALDTSDQQQQSGNVGNATSRWRTAASGVSPNLGDGATITWSIVPDNTPVTGLAAGETSDLIAFLDGIYGNGGATATDPVAARPWFGLLQQTFDAWENVSGVDFVYEPNDDGIAQGGSGPGVLGIRGDIRISGGDDSANPARLAFAQLPVNGGGFGLDGDLVIDTANAFYANNADGATGPNLGLHNTIAHEIGHSLGITHVIPDLAEVALMEPTISTAFRGPQHDDILGVQTLYGDVNTDNDIKANAVPLGALSTTSTVVSNVSIDEDLDVDWYSFEATSGQSFGLSVRPDGEIYDTGPQNGIVSTVDSRTYSDLRFEVYDPLGNLISNQSTRGLGETEFTSTIELLNPGTHTVAVFGASSLGPASGVVTPTQLYTLTLNEELITGPQLTAIRPDADGLLTDGDTLNVAPREFNLLFQGGANLDESTITPETIKLIRTGGDGVFGNADDVEVALGYVGLADPGSTDPEDLQRIVFRTASSSSFNANDPAFAFPDDFYQIHIIGSGTSTLNNLASEAFNNGNNVVTSFRLDRGAQIVSVVPQPVNRDSTTNTLSQDRNVIEVYFDDQELDIADAENKEFYRLYNAVTSAPAAEPTPDTVVYDAANNMATLTFANAIPEGSYRLDIGQAIDNSTAIDNRGNLGVSDTSISFDTAEPLGIINAAASADTTLRLSGNIERQTAIALPPLPGGEDDPGHREIQREQHISATGTTPTVPAAVRTIQYYFPLILGEFDSGDPLNPGQYVNLITETEKQIVRDIFEIYAKDTGIEFIEGTATGGLSIGKGDLRALSPDIGPASGVAGLGGPGSVVLNASLYTQSNRFYGDGFTGVMYHEVGHALSLSHAYDQPAVQGGGPVPNEVLPGDNDLLHLQRISPPNSTDIDVYSFNLPVAGQLTAEIFAERLTVADHGKTPSLLNSALSLYRLDAITNERILVARNDQYFGADAFLDIELAAGDYFVGVSSAGNTNYDLNVPNSGFGGTTDGQYELSLNFKPDAVTQLRDVDGTAFDGDADGSPGGVHQFWFQSADAANTFIVDKLADTLQATGQGSGTLASPFESISQGLAAAAARVGTSAASPTIVRIVGNGGFDSDLDTIADNRPYLVGTAVGGAALPDGAEFRVPAGVNVVIDAGTLIKMRKANIDAGSTAAGINRTGGSIQVFGTPTHSVFLRSFHDDTAGGNSDGGITVPDAGDFGGIVFRDDSDREANGIFLNYVNHADIKHGGGKVFVDSNELPFTSIHITNARPTLSFNLIQEGATAAISASPDSFDDSLRRIGPDIYGNFLVDNSINGLSVRIDTPSGSGLTKLQVSGRFDDADITHVLSENLIIAGGSGGPVRDAGGTLTARPAGRLQIDPGVVVKLNRARIEVERGAGTLIAEGTVNRPVIFTAQDDKRYGGSGAFDTNQSPNTVAQPGAWGGLFFGEGTSGSIDHASITFGGGNSGIEGSDFPFNAVEIHQSDVRIANSLLQDNAATAANSNSRRNGRGSNGVSTIYVRGAQPVIVNNTIKDNIGTPIDINANSLLAEIQGDYGRSTGPAETFNLFEDNYGPLIRLNRLENNGNVGAGVNGMLVRGEEVTVESVWDDTDIVHVVSNEVIVDNLHSLGGLTLQSSNSESLVIKLSGGNAGFTATGTPVEIIDRIGGTIHVLGTVGHPVVFTSINDDSVGAGFTATGHVNRNTNNSVLPTAGSPGDWRGLLFDEYSNDRNVAIVRELENPLTNNQNVNGTPTLAQNLGVLAPNITDAANPTPNQKSGDDNSRLGFEVHGFISPDDGNDTDVYSFTGTNGTPIWIDIDRTDSTLDVVVELIDASSGVTIASSTAPETFGGSGAATLTQNSLLGGDYYSQNYRDPGFYYVLNQPGAAVGSQGTFFVRVSSRAATGINEQSRGKYQLQIRTQQVDEFPGSTVRFSDIRYAATGIDVQGLPAHSPLLGEAGEALAGNGSDINDSFGSASTLINLLESDVAAIGLSGALRSDTDVDWYEFDLNQTGVQVIAGVNDGAGTIAVVLDIDYADGAVSADTTIAVYDQNQRLIYIGRESNVEDDQRPDGVLSISDLTRGSLAKKDGYIGPIHLSPGLGNQTYYVAVMSNRQQPSALNGIFQSNVNNATAQTRLEPVNSVTRIIEDHIGLVGYDSNGVTISPTGGGLFDITNGSTLNNHINALSFTDVGFYVATDVTGITGNSGSSDSLYTYNPLTGGNVVTRVSDSLVTGFDDVQDIVVRSDGRMFGYTRVGTGNNAGINNTTTVGALVEIDPSTGTVISTQNDNITGPTTPNVATTYSNQINIGQTTRTAIAEEFTTSDEVDAFTFQRTGTTGPAAAPVPTYDVYYAVRESNDMDNSSTKLYRGTQTGDATPTFTGPTLYGKVGDIQPAGVTYNTQSLTVFTDPSPPTSPPSATIRIETKVAGDAGNFILTASSGGNNANINISATATSLTLTIGQTATSGAVVNAINSNANARRYYTAVLFDGNANTPNDNDASVSVVTNNVRPAVISVVGSDGTGFGPLQGRVTGLSFGDFDSNANDTLYGVTNAGEFLVIDSNSGVVTNVVDTGDSIGVPDLNFQGLTLGPQNVDGGIHKNKLFAVTENGEIVAFDLDGTGLTTFDTATQAQVISVGGPGVRPTLNDGFFTVTGDIDGAGIAPRLTSVPIQYDAPATFTVNETQTFDTDADGGSFRLSFVDDIGAITSLATAIGGTNLSTTLLVQNKIGFPTSFPFVVQVENEQMLVTANFGANGYTVTRGLNATAAPSHSDTATVFEVVSSNTTGFIPDFLTTITIADTRPFFGSSELRIGSEDMRIVNFVSPTQITVIRGINGTAIASHNPGSDVFRVETTTSIAYDANAGTVQAALETLPSVGMGNVLVSDGPLSGFQSDPLLTTPVTVEFVGPTLGAFGVRGLRGFDLQQLTIDSTLLVGDEIQTLELDPRIIDGEFQLEFNGQITVAIPWDANSTAVQSALEGLSTIGPGNVSVTPTTVGGQLPTDTLRIQFINDLQDQDVNQIRMADGSTVKNEIQRLDFNARPVVGGSFQLRFANTNQNVNPEQPAGTQTGFIQFDATAGNIQGALQNAFSDLNGNIRVTGGPLNLAPVDIEFINELAGLEIEDLVVTGSSFSPSTRLVIPSDIQTVIGPVNQQQTFDFSATTIGGTFTLSINDSNIGNGTTAAIAHDASNAEIRDAIVATFPTLSDTIVNGGNVATVDDIVVTGRPANSTGPFTIEFVVDLAGEEISPVTIDDTSLITIDSTSVESRAAVLAVNQQQTIELFGTPTGGTFTLTLNDPMTGTGTTAPIPFNATSTDVRNALMATFPALTNATTGFDIVVTGGPINNAPIVVEFVEELAHTNIATITADDAALTGATISTSTISQAAVAPVNQQQTVEWLGGPTAGTYTLSIDDPNVGTATTAPIAFNASNTDVRDALVAAFPSLTNATTGFDIVVTGGPSNTTPLVIEFVEEFAATAIAAITADGALLTGSTGSNVGITQAAVAPVNQQQTVELLRNPTGGTFTLSINDVANVGNGTTAPIPFSATNNDIRDALVATFPSLTNATTGFDIVVTGGPINTSPIVIEFVEELATVDIAAITIDDNLITGTTASNTAITRAAVQPVNQLLSLQTSGLSTGTFTLTVDDPSIGTDTTGPLAFNATSTEVRDSLVATFPSLFNSTTSIYDIIVTGGPIDSTPIEIEFVADLATVTIQPITISQQPGSVGSSTITRTAVDSLRMNEIQQITQTGTAATAGDFTLTVDDPVNQITGTATINWNANATQVRTALQNGFPMLFGNIAVTGGSFPGAPFSIEFTNKYSGLDIEKFVVSANALTPAGAGVAVSTPRNIVPPVPQNEIQQIANTTPAVTGGTYTLSINDIANGVIGVSNTIQWNANAGALQTALTSGIPELAGNIQVTGGPLDTTPYQIEFINQLAALDIATLFITPLDDLIAPGNAPVLITELQAFVAEPVATIRTGRGVDAQVSTIDDGNLSVFDALDLLTDLNGNSVYDATNIRVAGDLENPPNAGTTVTFIGALAQAPISTFDPDNFLMQNNTVATIDASLGGTLDSVADSFITTITGYGANGQTPIGLAFSPLDFSLWHPTTRRATDAGHGINAADDNSRTPSDPDVTFTSFDPDREFSQAQGGASLYFGFEPWLIQSDKNSSTQSYLAYNGVNAQYGILTAAIHQDLSTNPRLTNTYDLPGGAFGAVETSTFDLTDAIDSDRPTLYFNYFLDTENHGGSNLSTDGNNPFRDSARVWIKRQGSTTWELVATNNSTLSAASPSATPIAELAGFLSHLSDGGLNSASPRSVSHQQRQELFDSTGQWRQARVDLSDYAGESGLELRFDFSTSGSLYNPNAVTPFDGNISTGFGEWIHSQRSTRSTGNNFEGFYVDDLIIGYAERGEMVTGAGNDAGVTDLDASNRTRNPDPDQGAEILTGPYQFEVRRTGEYQNYDSELPGTSVGSTYDTNDRHIIELSETSQVTFETAGFPSNTPIDTAQFGGLIPTADLPGVVPTFARSTNNPQTGSWSLESSDPVSAYQVTTTQLGATTTDPGVIEFTYAVAGSTDASIDDGMYFLIDGVAQNLVAPDPDFPNSTNTKLAKGQLAYRTVRFNLSSGAHTFTWLYDGRQASGSAFVDNVVFLQGGTGLAADLNREREQGQFVIESNFITDSLNRGINVEPGTAQGTSGGVSHPGSLINFPQTNANRLVPGVVITNNVVVGSGTGIRFAGETTSNPQRPVPFGRIVNNTLSGDSRTGTGIDIVGIASPTIMNNLFTDLNSSIANGSTAAANGSEAPIIRSNYFQSNNNNAATGTAFIDAGNSGSPFVDAANGNYYLVSGSTAIDSGQDNEQDRADYLTFKTELGIPESAIIAPTRDVYGQLRVDGSGSPTGGGSSVFIDRGAVDRSDQDAPYAVLLSPIDDDSADRDPNTTIVHLSDSLLENFTILLGDGRGPNSPFEGTGVDGLTVDNPNDPTIAPQAVKIEQNGVLLTQDVDYSLGYNELSGVLLLTPISTLWEHTSVYKITLDNTLIADRSGALLRPNQADGSTEFVIIVPEVDIDFGDAPASYGTLLGVNGARHAAINDNTPRLGRHLDGEADSAGVGLDDTPSVVTVDGNIQDVGSGPFTITVSGSTTTIALNSAPNVGDNLQVSAEGRSVIFELVLVGGTETAGRTPVFYNASDSLADITTALSNAMQATLPTQNVQAFANQPDSAVAELTLVGLDDEDGAAIGQKTIDGVTIDGLFLDPVSGDILSYLNPLAPGGAELVVNTVGGGLLDLWIDFNGDGDFLDAEDRVLTNELVLDGENRLLLSTPTSPGALTNGTGTTWARFRISRSGSPTHNGLVVGGEVEDYEVFIAEAPLPEPTSDQYGLADGLFEDNGFTVSAANSVGVNDTLAGAINPVYVLEDDVENGTLVFGPDGSIDYTPNADFYGTDTFTYRITGTQQVNVNGNPVDLPVRSSQAGTVTLTVDAVNDPPTATNKSIVTTEPSDTNTATSKTFTAADLLDGAKRHPLQDTAPSPYNEFEQTLKISQISVIDSSGVSTPLVAPAMMIDPTTPTNGTYTAGTHLADGVGGFVQTGTVTITVAGGAITTVVYQPAADYNEFNPLAAGNALSHDQFVFTVADSGKTSLPDGTLVPTQPAPETVDGTVTIQVRPQNDLPTATIDFIDGSDATYSTLPQEDVPYTISRTDLLANDFAGQSPTDDESLATAAPVNSNDGAIQLVTAQGATTFTGIGAINGGIAVDDSATGSGFIMYSVQNVFSRFAAAPPVNLPGSTNSAQLVAVRFNGTNWEYNNDTSWVVFTPDATDRLIASVDFTFKSITSLRYATGTVSGIEQGFVASDLTFTPNQFNGLDDVGEFTVSGTGFETSADPEFPTGFRAFPLTTTRGGTVSLDPATGDLIYLSAPDYYGADSFEYFVVDQGRNVAEDGTASTQVKYDSATVLLEVAPNNDAPQGTNKLFVTLEDTAFTITSSELLAGSVGHANPVLPSPWDESVQDAPNTNVVDLLIGGTTVDASNFQSLTYPIPTSTDPTDPRGFVTAINFVNGVFDQLIYQPATHFNMDNPRTNGARTFDGFDFFVGDDGVVDLPLGGTTTVATARATTPARAFIVVTPQNDAPSLQNDFIETNNAIWNAFSSDDPTEDQSLIIPAAFLFNNDANAPAGAMDELNLINDTATLAINPITFTTALGGSVQLLGTGDLRYTPPANAYGIDTFEYEAIDQGINEDVTGQRALSSETARATVTIILDPVNDPPRASDVSLAGTEDNSISFTASDLLQSALHSDAIPLPVSPFDESDQSLRVVAFATGSESIDAGRPQDHPELDANGTGTITTSSGSFGGEFEFNFINGAFTDGTYTPGDDYNSRTPFSSVEQFNYIIEDDDNGSTSVPGSTYISTDLPSLRSESAVVNFSISPVNDPVTFAGAQTEVNVSEIDTNVPAFISPWAVDVYPGNPSSLDEDQRERVVFTYIPPATPSGLFRLDPEITVNAQSRQATLTIHPAPDQVGTEVIVMRVEDADSQTPGFVPDTQLVTITVNVRPVNDPPEIDLTNLALSNDDGNTPADEAYDIATDGSIVLTLKEDNTSANGAVTPYLIPLNQTTGGVGYAPIGLLDMFNVGPSNEADSTEGGLQTLSLSSFPAQTTLGGSLTAVNNTSGQLIGLEYTPPADYNETIGASDSFTYIVSDSSVAGETFNLFNSQLESDPQTTSNRVRLVLRPVNDAPVFELSTNEVHSAEVQTTDSSNIQSFAGLAFNISTGPATATDESAFTNGQGKTFALTPNDFTVPVSSLFLVEPTIDANTGVLTYQAAPTVFGKFTFDVVLNDTGINDPARGDINTSLTQPLTIDIRPVNNAPTIKPAAADSLEFSTREGQTLLIPADGSTVAGDLLGAIDVGPANEAADIAPLPGGNQTVTLGSVPTTTTQGGTLTPITNGNGVITDYEYSPLLGFVGQDTFAYQVVDNGQTVLTGSGGVVDQPQSSTFEVTITVTSVNDAPVFTGGNDVVLDEDAGSVSIIDWATNVLPGPLNATDELATQQFSSVSIIKISGDDSFLTGLPVATPTGTSLTLNFDVIDNLSGSAIYELILVDNGPNDPANNDVNTTRHQFQIVVGVTNDPPTFDIPTQPVVQVAEGNVQYSQVWATNISPGPAPEPQTQTVARFDLTVPTEKAALFAVPPAIDPATGVLTFTPAQYANGVIEVEVVAIDSLAASSSQPPASPITLTIVIDPVNDVPVPHDDMINTDEDTVLQVEVADLLANDTDPDQPFDPTETIVVTSTLQATSEFGATLSFNAAGDIIYDPTTADTLRALSPNESLVDSFEYYVTNPNVPGPPPEQVATVFLNVQGLNDRPDVQSDAANVLPGGSVVIDVIGQDGDPGQDTDIDGTIDRTSLLVTLQPANGSVKLNADGTFTYTAQDGFVGTDSFKYTVADNIGQQSVPTTVTVNVSEVTTFANPDVGGAFAGDGDVVVDVLSNDTGVLNVASLRIETFPQNGTVAIQSDGTLLYSPTAPFTGEDSFSYSIADTTGFRSAPGEVTVRYVASGRQNPVMFSDVNASGDITPDDALRVINKLAEDGRGANGIVLPNGIPIAAGDRGPDFWDADGSMFVTPGDILFVLNQLAEQAIDNRSGEFAQASGELIVPDMIEVGTNLNRNGDRFEPVSSVENSTDKIVEASVISQDIDSNLIELIAQDEESTEEDVAAIDAALSNLF